MNILIKSCRFPSSLFSLTSINRFSSSQKISNNESIDLSYDLNDKFNSSKALVVAHGLFASKASWRSIAKRLNDLTKQKIYTVDMRNHGDTQPYVDQMTYNDMANDLASFIQKIVIEKDGVKSVSLLGHSMGGKAAMTLVLRQPSQISLINRLIVADIAPGISPSTENIKMYVNKMDSIDMNEFNHLDLFKARKQIDLKLSELEKLRNEAAQRQFLLTRVVKIDNKIQWHFNLKAIKNHVESVMNFDRFDSKFTKPTLFVGGAQSEYISDKDLPNIKHYFPNFELARISNAGHVIHFDNPVETMQTINKFINQ